MMEVGSQILENPRIHLFLSGGPVMFVLLGLWVLMVAIILVKVRQFAKSDLGGTGFIDDVLTAWRNGESFRVTMLLDQSRNPIARVLEKVLAVRTEGKSAEESEAKVQRAGSAEIHRLESRLRDLEWIATVAPLLGLLGTVLGMIEAFAQVERVGAGVDPTLLAGGIWQALLTTAYGLILAIPALSVAYLLQGRVDRLRRTMGEAVTELMSVPASPETESQ